jgi:hypothetical protein
MKHARTDDEDGVAVRVGFGDHVGGDIAAGAGLVFDHDRLAPDILQAVADQARGGVGGASRREGHDDAHRFRGPVDAGAASARGRKRWRGDACGRKRDKTAAIEHGLLPSNTDRPIVSGRIAPDFGERRDRNQCDESGRASGRTCGLVVRDARLCRAPHHEGLAVAPDKDPHPEERAFARVSKDGGPEAAAYSGSSSSPSRAGIA